MIKKIFIITIIAILAVIYRFLQIFPGTIGSGEFKASPNQGYQAHVTDLSSESFWGEKKHWFEFKITEYQSQEVIYSLETTPIPGPYFGSRSSYSVITWSEDSSEVLFKFPNIEIKYLVKPNLTNN